MTRPVAALAAVLVGLWAGAAGAQGQPALHERDSVEIAPHANVRLDEIFIDNRLGNVIVLGHDAPTISLSVNKKAESAEVLERLKVNLIPDPAGAIRISTTLLLGNEARPVSVGSARIDITVVAPRSARVDVKAWNGKISVTGMRQGASLSAHEADIIVNDVRGVVTTHNARGTQELVGVDGVVTAGGAYGDMSLEKISGDSLDASTHRGNIEARRVRSRSVRIRSTFGNITFHGALVAGGQYDIGSYKGDLEIRFHKNTFVDIEAWSRDGAVESQLQVAEQGRPEIGRMRLLYGRDRSRPAVLQVSSVAGNVRLGLVNE